MRILITGGTGLLGKALIETGAGRHAISSVYVGDYMPKDKAGVRHARADICDGVAMERSFAQARPEVVIHTAGNANVDYCENNYDEAWRSNVIGTNTVAELCRKCGARLVFISTNAVFGGDKAPYSEKSPTLPVNSYGRMKLEAENVAKNIVRDCLIVRPILMFGWNDERERSNIVTWLLEMLKNRKAVHMVDDVRENPILNIHCAEAIWRLVEGARSGVYHVAGKDVVTRFEFAMLVADVFGLDKGLVCSVSSSYFHNLARRPANTSYDTSKLERDAGIKPPCLRESLVLMKETPHEEIARR